MSRSYFSLLFPLLLLVSGFQVMPPQQTQTPGKAAQPEKAAQEAAESWLRLIDSGKYAESWDELAEVTKAKVPKDSWEKLRSSAGRSSDVEESKPRKLHKASSVPSLIGIGDQAGVMLEYGSRQDRHHSNGELVELVLEDGRGWRVAYYMRMSLVFLYDPTPGTHSQAESSGKPPSLPVQETIQVDPITGTLIGEPRGEPGLPSAGPGKGFGSLALGDGDRNAVATAVDQRPVPLNAPQPQYTKEARDNKIQGVVIMRVLVGADGTVKQVRVTRGLPDGLDEQAIQAAHQLRFRPAMKGGQPVAFWHSIQIEFNLK
jgi:TonB family protein